jgi:hypothetical protein
MIQIGSMQFREIWLVDFEFAAPSGEQPKPVCLVAHELTAGRTLKIWQDQLQSMDRPPYAVDKDSLFVAFYASAEMGCHLALNWPLPENVLDLFPEFRNRTNGLTVPCGNSLLGALTYFGLGGIEAAEKRTMRDLAMRGGPWTQEEQTALLTYCESDVKSSVRLFVKMAPHLDLPHALLRGRYMKAAAVIEHNGVPIDTESLSRLREYWDNIQDSLIAEIDKDYGVYEERTFKAAHFANWLASKKLPWPRLDSGRLELSDDAFKEMARTHPEVAPLRELRVTLSQMRLSDLAVGRDGRNRCLLSAFQARTSRNQPSTSKFIFGPAVWMRGLICPEEGYGLAYLDWSQQEFGIAAALSGDPLMIEAYESGDPYLAFAKQAGAVPSYATKETHRSEREQFKACALAVQYGMGAKSLASRIGQHVILAKALLHVHHETYRAFWKWSDSAVDCGMLHGKLWTVFGWTVRPGMNPNPRSFRNFPMQANGAEMLRLACCLAVEAGIRVCAPIHDAIMIEAPLDELDETVAMAQQLMSDASASVLAEFRLRSDVKVIRYPERYMDERGVKMWNTVWSILEGLNPNTGCARVNTSPVRK